MSGNGNSGSLAQAGVARLEDQEHKVTCEVGLCTVCGKAKVTCAKGKPQQGVDGVQKCATCWLNDDRTLFKAKADPIHPRLFQAAVADLICVYWFSYRNRCKPFLVLHFRVTP
jgi:hypothetical protein